MKTRHSVFSPRTANQDYLRKVQSAVSGLLAKNGETISQDLLILAETSPGALQRLCLYLGVTQPGSELRLLDSKDPGETARLLVLAACPLEGWEKAALRLVPATNEARSISAEQNEAGAPHTTPPLALRLANVRFARIRAHARQLLRGAAFLALRAAQSFGTASRPQTVPKVGSASQTERFVVETIPYNSPTDSSGESNEALREDKP